MRVSWIFWPSVSSDTAFNRNTTKDTNGSIYGRNNDGSSMTEAVVT